MVIIGRSGLAHLAKQPYQPGATTDERDAYHPTARNVGAVLLPRPDLRR